MAIRKRSKNRLDLLADVAEMYYINDESQADIAEKVGVTRSMISRMLTEARELGMVKIEIERAISQNQTLSKMLAKRFNLKHAIVVENNYGQPSTANVGKLTAKLLIDLLEPGDILGTTWGKHIGATVENLKLESPIPGIKVCQLMGAFRARTDEYDGLAIVYRMAERLGGDAFYLNSPLVIENEAAAVALRESESLLETLNMAKKSRIALMGVGATQHDFFPYFAMGNNFTQEIRFLRESGAIGDVCGTFFNIKGQVVSPQLQERIINIKIDDLMNVPIRIAIGAGFEKVLPFIGLLRGNFANIVVTDASTAQSILQGDSNNK